MPLPPAAAAAETPLRMPGRAIVVVLAGIAAAWLAAGSLGMITPPLGRAVVWIMFLAIFAAAWPGRRATMTDWAVLAAGAVVGFALTLSPLDVVNVFGVAVVLAAVARIQQGAARQAILTAAAAVAVLAVWRLTCDTMPGVSLAADTMGGAMGWLAGWITGRPLEIGASFGGVDLLVLMIALYGGWLAATAPPRRGRAIAAAAAILAGHAFYLVALAFHEDLAAVLPAVPPTQPENSRMTLWVWSNALRSLLPWNLPLLAGLIQGAIAAAMLRWGCGAGVSPASDAQPARPHHKDDPGTWLDDLARFGPAALAIALALLLMLNLRKPELTGRTIVAYHGGGALWSLPGDDRPIPPGTPTYAALPQLVACMGGRFLHSADFSEADLKAADVVLLLDARRQPGGLSEAQTARIGEFASQGGAVLVATGPGPSLAAEGFSSQLLKQTAMRLDDATTVSATENWEHNCRPFCGPATIGLRTTRNQLGLGRCCPIDTGWPAEPLVVGRWGRSEAPLGSGTQTDRLGDLVLVAKQRIGQGRIAVLGDASCLSDEMISVSYPFAVRLLADLAGKAEGPQALWRQLLGLVAAAGLVAMLYWRPDPMRLVWTAGIFGAALVASAAVSESAAEMLPGGKGQGTTRLAYIDGSHLDASSSDPANVSEKCRPRQPDIGEDRDRGPGEGLGEFSRTLLRNGYLPLVLPELTPERLDAAAMLVSIAPARPFSSGERAAVKRFVERGGIFISMVGGEQWAASRELLGDFGFSMEPTAEAMAVQEFLVGSGKEKPKVSFYSAWPVVGGPGASALVWRLDGKQRRDFIVSRRCGGGYVVLIGDGSFAMNKNMEAAADQPPENVRFWRWLLNYARDQEEKESPESAAPSEPSAPEPVEHGLIEAPGAAGKKGAKP